MSTVEAIKDQIKSLSAAELAELRDWLLDHKSIDMTETAHLLQSPRNAQRLLRALRRAQQR